MINRIRLHVEQYRLHDEQDGLQERYTVHRLHD
jgi:hypothetical protein